MPKKKSKLFDDFASHRLPPGQHKLPRDVVRTNQRWRILGAAAQLVSGQGLRGATASAVARRAGVSVQTFYEHFDGTLDCLAAVSEVAADYFCEALFAAACEVPRTESWLEAAVMAALEVTEEEPDLAHFLSAELAVGVPATAATKAGMVRRLVEASFSRPDPPGYPAVDHLAIHALLDVILNRREVSPAVSDDRFASDLSDLLRRRSVPPKPA